MAQALKLRVAASNQAVAIGPKPLMLRTQRAEVAQGVSAASRPSIASRSAQFHAFRNRVTTSQGVSALSWSAVVVVYGKLVPVASRADLKVAFHLAPQLGLDFSNMVDFVAEHGIHPVIDKVFPLDDAVHAFDRMKDGFQFGKIVIEL